MKWVGAISVAAFLAVLLTIDASGDFPSLEGPGITLDESFHVDVGWYIVVANQLYGLAALAPSSQMEIFDDENNYNPDHPPLGRIALGVSEALVGPAAVDRPAEDSARWSISAARPAAAAAFGLTVLICGLTTLRISGGSQLAAAAACVCLATTPRVFGHAHQASLESFVGFFFAGCVYYLAWTWSDKPTLRSGAIGGLLWGLLLLTKIQAVLIPIPLTIWAFWLAGRRAFLPLAAVAFTGLFVFAAGWPWLWHDFVAHIPEYFRRGSDRVALNVFFAGEVWTDRTVPFVYTIVMFLVTTPVHWLLAMGLGISTSRSLESERARHAVVLLGGTAAFVVAFFSLPAVAVYDGVRLYLVCWPLLAPLAGLGVRAAWTWTASRLPSTVVRASTHRVGQVAIVTTPFIWLLVTGPCWLSHYNIAIGGLPGATKLGFEANYWGDSLTAGFWRRVAETVPAGSAIAVTPELHQFQLATIAEQVPIIGQRRYRLVSYKEQTTDPATASNANQSETEAAQYVVAFRRRADLAGEVVERFTSRDGVIAAEARFGEPIAICFDRNARASARTTD